MIKSAPSSWNGSAKSFIDSVLSTTFFSANAIASWNEYLQKKAADSKSPLILPAPQPEMRQKWGTASPYTTKTGRKIIFSDKAPLYAIATYLLSHSELTIEKTSGLFLQLPFHNFDLDRFTKWTGDSNNAQTAGWIIAHLVNPSAAQWEKADDSDLQKVMIQFLSPLNFFLFPHFQKAGILFAEDPKFQSLMAHKFQNLYSNAFSALVGVFDFSSLPEAADYNIEVSAPTTALLGKSAATQASPKAAMTELVKKLQPTEAFDLKLLTVPENSGYHSRVLDTTVMAKGVYDIKLDYKMKSGDISTIGFFRLNIKDLFEKKYIARTEEGFKLSIYKTDDGFAVASRKNSPALALPV